DLSGVADSGSISDWASDAMNWAVAEGIITGKSGGKLDPSGLASRAEVATMLQRFIENTLK
ncbi:S-layer homology domain-containing protein, partial [Bacteroides thetaiotaomicron]